MALYSVFGPRGAEGEAALERARFIKDGFSWAAFLFGPLWLLANRVWLGLVGWLALAALLVTLARGLNFDAAGSLALALALQIFLGLEANEIRRGALMRRGQTFLGLAGGRNRNEAERLFFSKAAAEQAPPSRGSSEAPAGGRGNEVLGLFPNDRGLR